MTSNKQTSTTISIRLKHEELEQIKKEAAAMGVNLNRYIVNTLINGSPTAIDPEVMCRLKEAASIITTPKALQTEDIINRLREDVDFIWQTSLKL